MDKLNNPDSEIYKKTLETQKLYISSRMNTIKSRYLEDKMYCCGEKEEIAKHLNMGHAQNLIQSFFKTNSKCVICENKIGDNSVKQIERAHCNLYSRYDLLIMALNDIYTDNITPIKVGDILKLFIQKHEICPIYMLCNICHKQYDSKFTTL